MGKRIIIIGLLLSSFAVWAQEPVRKFRDAEKTISLPLPRSWNYRSSQQGPVNEFKVTQNFLMNDHDPFNTGVSVIRTKNAVLSFQKGARLLVETRKSQLYEALSSDSSLVEHKTGQYAAGDYLGIIVDMSYRDNPASPALRMFVIWLVGETDLIEIRMIALAEEWGKMAPVYMNALSELDISR